MEKEQSSTYYFIGRLFPAELCVKFNPREIHLGNGLVLDIFMDGISIWIPGTKEKFEVIRPLVTEAFDIIINTFMLITNLRLSYNIQSWVEAKNIVSKSNLIGWFMPPGLKLISPNPKNKFNVIWRKVGKFYLKIKNSFYHKIALTDYKNCVTSYGDDAFFYAFRIVEDIKRAVTQNLPEGLDKKKYWEEMHKTLGTDENIIRPLTDVSEKVRHGELDNSIVTNARKKREEVIDIAFKIMRKEFRRSFKGLI